MLLNLLTACQQPPELPPPSKEGFYLKASQNRLLPSESTVDLAHSKSLKKRRKRNSVTTVIIGTPTGFRHEFHLGRDVVRAFTGLLVTCTPR